MVSFMVRGIELLSSPFWALTGCEFTGIRI